MTLGYQADYLILGSKRDKVKQAGNAVTPRVTSRSPSSSRRWSQEPIKSTGRVGRPGRERKTMNKHRRGDIGANPRVIEVPEPAPAHVPAPEPVPA